MLKLLLKLYKTTYGKHIINKYNVQAKNQACLNTKGPYLILSNHVNNYDPFFIQMYADDVISYVTSNAWFRNKYLGWILSKIGAIPKKKFVSDLETIRQIIKLAKKGRIISIFPEGRRTWDGKTKDVIYSTAKLIKILKIPVICCTIKGGMLSFPRWAKYGRVGKIELEFKSVLSAERIKPLTVKDIYAMLVEEIDHDDYDWQKQQHIPFKGKKLAERLEKFIFCCPKCQSMNTLSSHNNTLVCHHCSYKVEYNAFGYLENKAGNSIFKTTKEWNDWQLDFLKDKLKDKDFQLRRLVTVFLENKTQPLFKYGSGQLKYQHNRFVFIGSKEQIMFEPALIHGSNVQGNSKWQFYYNKTFYRFVFEEDNAYGYQWYILNKLLDK